MRATRNSIAETMVPMASAAASIPSNRHERNCFDGSELGVGEKSIGKQEKGKRGGRGRGGGED